MEIQLQDRFLLKFQSCDQGVHLVLTKDGEDYVCRKCSVSELSKMVDGETHHLFKGRLQFQLVGQGIQVVAKEVQVGILSVEFLREVVCAAKSKDLPDPD